MATVLGIKVGAAQLAQWREWFAPAVQPFPTDRLGEVLGEEPPPGRDVEPSPEIRDTFQMYGGSWTWLDEREFGDLSLKVRRALLSGREARRA